MPCYKPEYLFGVEGFVQELRTMSFVIGFGTAPFYAQIRHDRHEEKCRVKVTLNSNSEDIPSVMFEAGGRNYIHACQEVARIAIGELRDRYSDQLADTEYRYHPCQPQGSDRGRSGMSRQAAPEHKTQRMPLSINRSSLRGRPIFCSGETRSLISSQAASGSS